MTVSLAIALLRAQGETEEGGQTSAVCGMVILDAFLRSRCQNSHCFLNTFASPVAYMLHYGLVHLTMKAEGVFSAEVHESKKSKNKEVKYALVKPTRNRARAMYTCRLQTHETRMTLGNVLLLASFVPLWVAWASFCYICPILLPPVYSE